MKRRDLIRHLHENGCSLLKGRREPFMVAQPFAEQTLGGAETFGNQR